MYASAGGNEPATKRRIASSRSGSLSASIFWKRAARCSKSLRGPPASSLSCAAASFGSSRSTSTAARRSQWPSASAASLGHTSGR